MGKDIHLTLTEYELKVLRFYMDKALIDVEGGAAIGIASKEEVAAVKSIIFKLA